MGIVSQDVRFAFRLLRRSPAFTVTAVVLLAIAIGANTAVFSVVESVLLRPLAYRDPGRLVVLSSTEAAERGLGPVAPGDYLDLRRTNHSFTDVAAAESWGPILHLSSEAEKLRGVRVTANLFPLLGIAPRLGRDFHAEEEQPGNEQVVILSDRLWKRRFDGDPAVVGRPIDLGGQTYRVAGVMPAGFEFPPFWATGAEIWAPLAKTPDQLASHDASSLRLFARLRNGVSLEQARAGMASIATRFQQDYPRAWRNRSIDVRSLQQRVTGDVGPTLLALQAAVLFLLLIACTNIGNLLLARGLGRQREVAVRRALGAGRVRLVRQFLTEAILLALLGGLAGVLLASFGVDLLSGLLAHHAEALANVLPRAQHVALDRGVLLFNLASSLGAGVLFGLMPALASTGGKIREGMSHAGRGATEGRGVGRIRSVLLAVQVALALVLVVAGGWFLRSFANLGGIAPGFRPDGALTGMVNMAGSHHQSAEAQIRFYRELLDRSRQIPGVTAAGATNHLPLKGDEFGFHVAVEGRPSPNGDGFRVTYRVSTPGYFRAAGATLAGGRDFSGQDGATSPLVAVVNEAFARQLLGGANPVGRRFKFGGDATDAPWYTVVGVVDDIKQQQWAAPVSPEVHVCYAQAAQYFAHFQEMTFVLRTAGDPATLAGPLREATAALDPTVPLSKVLTLRQAVSDALLLPGLTSGLVAALAAAALLLAAAGIFGMMSYAVSRRRREIGLRMALGARPGQLTAGVLREALAYTALGVAAGLATVVALAGSAAPLLYHVNVWNPGRIVASALLMAAAAMAGAAIPAWRASKVDPLETLSSD